MFAVKKLELKKINDEFAGKQKRILGATKPNIVLLLLPDLWERAVPRLYYYVNIILKIDPTYKNS